MPLGRYLARHAEPEVALLQSLPGQWPYARVIPAFDEAPDFLTRLPADGALTIVVANRPDNSPNSQWLADIYSTLGVAHWQQGHLSLHQPAFNHHPQSILLVDRCLQGPPLPAKQGVGLARKIGCDIGCQLIFSRQIESPWLGTTDADTQLPADYGQCIQALPNAAAACVFPFLHTVADAPDWPIRCYELHMLHYVAGLRFADSPYAWPTIGSCIALHSRAYVQAHGFPKRAGGEDFYLLNKLAKLGGIVHAQAPRLAPSGRTSLRVPFGTGPALQRYAALGSADDVTSYHPESFRLLRAAILALRTRSHEHDFPLTEAAESCDTDAHALLSLWQQFDCENAIRNAHRNSRSAAQCERHLMTWFDGFKTLKWIHACREHWPDKPLFECLQNADWLTDLHIDDSQLHNTVVAAQQKLTNGQQLGLPSNAGRGPKN